jgi:hypothetical protein
MCMGKEFECVVLLDHALGTVLEFQTCLLCPPVAQRTVP